MLQHLAVQAWSPLVEIALNALLTVLAKTDVQTTFFTQVQRAQVVEPSVRLLLQYRWIGGYIVFIVEAARRHARRAAEREAAENA